MVRLIVSIACALSALVAVPALANERPKQERILGWLEHVRVEDANLVLDAKLDTGAKTSSIDAEIIKIDEDAEDKGEGMVVFEIENERGTKRVIEAEIVRFVDIKDKRGGTIRRPVVKLEFCVAGVPVEGEVNLADRGHMNYPLLVGRTMLADAAILVNPDVIYTDRKARCS